MRLPGDRGNQPAGLEEQLKALTERVVVLERHREEVDRAFPMNDIARPDYDGHRRTHVKMEEANKLMESYKVGVTKQILSAAVVFVLGLLSSGGIQWAARALSGAVK
jgi:hypothetical protein